MTVTERVRYEGLSELRPHSWSSQWLTTTSSSFGHAAMANFDGDLPTEGGERTAHSRDQILHAGAHRGLDHRRSFERELVAVSAENLPARAERDVAAWMSVEADDRYDHLAPHGPSDHISPRVCDNPLDRDARADLLGQDPGDRVLERLGPAVQHQELDPIGADAGYDLAAFEVVGYAHGPDADTSSAGFPTLLEALDLDSTFF